MPPAALQSNLSPARTLLATPYDWKDMDLLPDDQARVADQLAQLASDPAPGARQRILEAVSRVPGRTHPSLGRGRVRAAVAAALQRFAFVPAALRRGPQPPQGRLKLVSTLLIGFLVGSTIWFIPNALRSPVRAAQLTAAEQALLGGVDESLASNVSFDSTSNAFVFNQAGKTPATLPQGISQNQTGPGDSPYSADLPLDPTAGFTYYDDNLQLSFSLIPTFQMSNAKQDSGRITYGLENQGAAVYTVKNNGLKEDILYDHHVDKEVFGYTLKLPSTMEARMIPGSQAVGIYSADRSLYQHISFGSDADKLKVMQARENSPKNYLVFALAPPTVKQSPAKDHGNHQQGGDNQQGNGNQEAKVSYRLSSVTSTPSPSASLSKSPATSPSAVASALASQASGSNTYTLTVNADHLADLSYPISIDPSVVVNTPAGFALGNNEGGIDFGTNQISRGTTTGGVLASWTATTSLTSGAVATASAGSAAYNGYVYEIGGCTGTCAAADANVYYDSINANGTLGATWSAATSLPVATMSAASVAYNGYLYEIGGFTSGASMSVSAKGGASAGTTSGTTTFTGGAGALAGGLAGAGGGSSAGTAANGNPGSGTTGGAAPAGGGAGGNGGHFPVGYNGLPGTAPGGAGGGGGCQSVSICGGPGAAGAAGQVKIIETGGVTNTYTAAGTTTYTVPGGITQITVQAWGGGEAGGASSAGCGCGGDGGNGGDFAQSVFSVSASQQFTVVVGAAGSGSLGAGGDSSATHAATSGATASVYYALICTGSNSGTDGCTSTAGTLGTTWHTNGSYNLTAATYNATSVVYNGVLYEIGGYTTAITANVYYNKINADGSLSGSWTLASALPVATDLASSVAYNGYVYDIAGVVGASSTLVVDYAQINSDGSLGAWAATTPLPGFAAATRAGATSVVYDGYLYVVGGCHYTISGCVTLVATALFAPTNANGTVGAWSGATAIGTATTAATSVAYNGYVYEIGGCTTNTCSAITGNTTYAQIQPAGYLGNWTATTSIATTHDDTASSVAYNGYLYVMGGCPSSCSSAPTTTVEYDTINADGTLGASWTTAANALPGARARAAAVAYNGYLYELGGCSATCTGSATEQKTVYYSLIGAAGAPGVWSSSANQLPDVYQWASAFVYNGYIYHLGGCGGSTCPDNKIYYSLIGAAGAPGAWSTNATSLPLVTDAEAVVAYDGYVFALGVGGSASGGGTTQVNSAPISTNGSIGTWSGNLTALLHATQNPTAAASNGYIWFVGGYTNNPTAEVDYALICTGQNNGVAGCGSTAGTLGTWNTATSLPGAVYESAGAIYNGYFYNIGGNGTAVVDYAPLDAGGSGILGGWAATTSLTAATEYAASVAYNGYLYEIGGNTGSGITANVYYVAINPGGALATPWQSATSLPSPTYYVTSIAYNGFLYAIGGCGTPCATAVVDYAPINANGTLGAWTATTSLPAATRDATSVAYNGYVYEIGGIEAAASAVVDYALICTGTNSGVGGCGATAGTLGTWNATSSLSAATYDSTSVAYNGYVYEIGGFSGVAATANVYYAPINGDGTLSTWTATTSLPAATADATTVAYNGYVYEIGGCTGSCSAPVATVDFAPLNSNGTIGTWTPTTSLPAATYVASSVVYNGYVYEISGYTNALTTTVDYAPLNVTPMVGHYSYLTNIGNANNGIASITDTGSMPSYSGPGTWYVSYRSAPATGVLSASALASSLSGINTAGPPTCNGTQQYFWLFISIDDSNSFTFGGDSLRSNITSFTINYGTKHPAPNQRLRGGQYFLGTSPQPLDTCYP